MTSPATTSPPNDHTTPTEKNYSPLLAVVGLIIPLMVMFAAFATFGNIVPVIQETFAIPTENSSLLSIPVASLVFIVSSMLSAFFLRAMFPKKFAKISEVLGLKNFQWKKVFTGLSLGILYWFLVTGVSIVVASLSPENGGSNTTTQNILSLNIVAFLLLTGVFVALVTPIVEELFFRGVILRSLWQQQQSKTLKLFSILLTSIVFGLVHFQGWGTPADILAIAVPAGLGFIAGMLAVKHDNVYGAIGAHISYNAIVCATLAFSFL